MSQQYPTWQMHHCVLFRSLHTLCTFVVLARMSAKWVEPVTPNSAEEPSVARELISNADYAQAISSLGFCGWTTTPFIVVCIPKVGFGFWCTGGKGVLSHTVNSCLWHLGWGVGASGGFQHTSHGWHNLHIKHNLAFLIN